jgi:hypothetical protein
MKLKALFESVHELAPYLKANCAQALDLVANNGLFFYRGVARETQEESYSLPGFKDVPVAGPIKVDRERGPRDTPVADHEVMDKWFKKHKGFAARSQALFVTPDIDQAEMYGATFIVLPIGKFNAYWSETVRDLTVSMYNGANLSNNPIPGNMAYWSEKGYDTKDDVPRREQVKYIEDVLKGGKYKKNRFGEMHSNLGEIMIDCEEYLMIPADRDAKRAVYHVSLMD